MGSPCSASSQVKVSALVSLVPSTHGVMLCAAVRAVASWLGPSMVDKSRASCTTSDAVRPFKSITRTSSGNPGSPESNTHNARPSIAHRMGRVPCKRSTSHIQSYAETALWLSCMVCNKRLDQTNAFHGEASGHASRVHQVAEAKPIHRIAQTGRGAFRAPTCRGSRGHLGPSMLVPNRSPIRTTARSRRPTCRIRGRVGTLVSFFHHGQDGRHSHDFSFVIVNLHAVAHDAFGHILGLTTFLCNFLHHGQLHPNGGSGINGLGEAALINAIVEQHRPFLSTNSPAALLKM